MTEKTYDNMGRIINQVSKKDNHAIINTSYTYDPNDNMIKEVVDGKENTYKYDEFNQLTQLIQGKYIYDYSYDAENERIKQVRTDTMDYHYDEWYNYTVDYDIVGDKQIEDGFEKLRQQVDKKQTNGNLCSSILSDKYDRIYNYKPEVTEYTLDRNVEYTEVLQENDTVHIYGDTLLQSDDNDIITGLNNSVIARVSEDVKKITYSDYGNTDDIVKGHGYNSEMMDSSGLIYLRARYYDPGISRFVQIDTKYNGEKESIASQNKYVYTLNNPYKYVDRNGNWSLFETIGNFIKETVKIVVKAVTQTAKKVVEKVIKPISPTIAKTITETVDKVEKTVTKVVDGLGKNKPTNKGGGSTTKKPEPRNIVVSAKCPEKQKSGWDKFVDCLTGAGKKVINFGKAAWKGLQSIKDAVWDGICEAGSFVVKKGKEFLSWVDGILDTVAQVGAVVVFAAGVVATAATIAAAIPALAGATVLGASIGAIGYAAGSFALYAGAAVMTVSGVQAASGYSGYRLDGSKLGKS